MEISRVEGTCGILGVPGVLWAFKFFLHAVVA